MGGGPFATEGGLRFMAIMVPDIILGAYFKFDSNYGVCFGLDWFCKVKFLVLSYNPFFGISTKACFLMSSDWIAS
jgi:hypothetical protein